MFIKLLCYFLMLCFIILAGGLAFFMEYLFIINNSHVHVIMTYGVKLIIVLQYM